MRDVQQRGERKRSFNPHLFSKRSRGIARSRMAHSDNQVIAELVRLECTGRYIYVPGDKVKRQPRDARAKILVLGNEITITSHRYGASGSLKGSSLLMLVILVAVAVSALYSLYTWIPIYALVALIFCTAVLTLFLVGLTVGYVFEVFDRHHGEVLHIDRERVSLLSTCLKNASGPVAVSKVKAIGIDDPNVGAELDSSCGFWGQHVTLVFLDHRRVKLIGVPILTLEEAEWLAGFILERYPQMFDAGVLSKAEPNRAGIELKLIRRPVSLHQS